MRKLTICGIAHNNNGIRRPNLSVTYANNKVPIIAPAHVNEAIIDDSSVVIWPVGSGEFSDKNNNKLGDVQPHEQPKFNAKMFTISKRNSLKSNL